MDKIKLGNSDLNISKIAYGTSELGLNQTKEEAFNCINTYIEEDGNLLDTAHVYSNWVKGEESRSEKIIGKYLKKYGNRDRIIISTKGAHPKLSSMDITRVDKVNIEKDIQESLRYLGVQYIDLFFLHRDNENLSIEEIIGYLEEHKKRGDIRYYGLSNYSHKRLEKAILYAKENNIDGLITNQSGWSALRPQRNNDKSMVYMNNDLMGVHSKNQFPYMAYSPLQGGAFLKDKDQLDKQNKEIVDILEDISKKDNMRVSQIMLSYLYSRSEFQVIPIIGTRNLKRIKYALKNSDYRIDKEDIKKIDEIYFRNI